MTLISITRLPTGVRIRKYHHGRVGLEFDALPLPRLDWRIAWWVERQFDPM